MKLADIIPVHAPHDRAKLKSLRAAYESENPPPPIVVLTDGPDGYDFALTGAHRLAAMLSVYDGEIDEDDLDDEVVLVDWEETVDVLEAYECDEAIKVLADATIDGIEADGREAFTVTSALVGIPAKTLRDLNPRLLEALRSDGAFL